MNTLVQGVKASGGVRTYADALVLISRGAMRLGANGEVAIVSGEKTAAGGY
ncbi:MAG: hypothetical protein NTV54_15360 [Ignavibacteriales bacterium]|nr:hypothetical protein [Ignavibacteriales bacterium]